MPGVLTRRSSKRLSADATASFASDLSATRLVGRRRPKDGGLIYQRGQDKTTRFEHRDPM